MNAKQTVSVTINGQLYVRECEPRLTLADFIRRECGLTGTHLGCEQGVCGACTVSLSGESVRSCLMFAVQADNASITTVEGLADGEELSPLQACFSENHGLQCGFCTSGMLISARELLEENPDPTAEEARTWLAGNLCRCTGYDAIISSVLDTAKRMRAASS
ncbi:(2Fe-2S)-binding protein [Pseudonocardia asaccharolytica]|uniref:(2Fe-2S)-binding protein n=1 Tax=Pseudonocardia asaccharolytica DSM 44247 = NBRC 16224 TaxID=1123024 RepID=A0A511D4Z5_9PSEU|nr:(2Fe-2S)-binding protein [Pseudonocardia asaccharolytica]GEL19869.1 (2Fe-2S)-binding protein [Pseudonocardia asaccharolytica DSM 44247 = NBRC 16224]